MNAMAKTLSTATFAAVLSIGAGAFCAIPAAAEPPGNNSCTAYFITGAVEQEDAPGRDRISGYAKQYAKTPGTNLGEGLVSQEAHWDRDDCSSFQPTN